MPVRQEQRSHRRMGRYGNPSPLRQHQHLRSTHARRQIRINVAQDEVDDQPLQFLSVRDIPVQRHRSRTEFRGSGAHR